MVIFDGTVQLSIYSVGRVMLRAQPYFEVQHSGTLPQALKLLVHRLSDPNKII
jgi:hypothetical protein